MTRTSLHSPSACSMSMRVLADHIYTQIAITLRLALMDTQDTRTYGDIIQDVVIPMPDESRENAFDYVILLIVVATMTADGLRTLPGWPVGSRPKRASILRCL